jgi:hypothetical protein
MEMLGTFLPWNARTLVVCWLRPAVPSAGGICRCRWSCCRSFVVVIFVNKPATISIMSETGMSLISYWGPTCAGSRRCRRNSNRDWEKGLESSMAKLWMWDKLLTLILLGEQAGDCREWAGEGCTGAGPDEGTVRVFANAPEAGLEPVGVGCWECGRTRGLGGTGAVSCEADALELCSAVLCCCECWLGVELDGGAPESAMATSAGGATTRGALALDDGDGRTGVCCTAGVSCVCLCVLPPPNMLVRKWFPPKSLTNSDPIPR